MALPEDLQSCTSFTEMHTYLQNMRPEIGASGGRYYKYAKNAYSMNSIVSKFEDLYKKAAPGVSESIKIQEVINAIKDLEKRGDEVYLQADGMKKFGTCLKREDKVHVLLDRIPRIDTVRRFDNDYRKLQEQCSDVLSRLRRLEITVTSTLRAEFEGLRASGEQINATEPSADKSPEAFLQERRQKIEEFENKVSSFEERCMQEFSRDLEITDSSVGKRIFIGAQNGWKDFLKEDPPGVFRQSHGIPHLKVYRDPQTGQLVADYGMDDLGSGRIKKAKVVRRIGQGIGHVLLVRMAPSQKDTIKSLKAQIAVEQDESRRRQLHDVLMEQLGMFEIDVKNEVDARNRLHRFRTPFITEMTEIRYVNKKGEKKTRYFMKKYEGDLEKLLRHPTHVDDRQRALECCSGVIACLRVMHEHNLVHADVKGLNILFEKDDGFLNDFGLMNDTGTPVFHHWGVLEYMAPETWFGDGVTLNPTMDIFSFGVVLLHIVHPEIYAKWISGIVSLREKNKIGQTFIDQRIEQQRVSGVDPNVLAEMKRKQQKSLDQRHEQEYIALHTSILDQISRSPSSYSGLIPRLMAYRPADRPTSAEVEKACREIPTTL